MTLHHNRTLCIQSFRSYFQITNVLDTTVINQLGSFCCSRAETCSYVTSRGGSGAREGRDLSSQGYRFCEHPNLVERDKVAAFK